MWYLIVTAIPYDSVLERYKRAATPFIGFRNAFTTPSLLIPESWFEKLLETETWRHKLMQDPLDLSFWSFLTFLHNGIQKVERHFLWKFHKKNSKEKLVKCATEVARLHRVSYKVVHKIGRLRKFNHAREIEFNFFTAWTIFMKLGTLIHHVHGYKMLPQIF